MATSKSTEIQLFGGGINLVPAAHLLQPSESRFLGGINTRKGNLYPYLAPLFIEEASGDYMYHFEDEYNYYALYRSNVLFNRIWYWTSVNSAGKVYPDGTEAPLGIDPPVGKPLASLHSTLDGFEGAITYVYTYYDSKSGAESPPSTPSNTIELLGPDAGNGIELSNLTPSPDGYQTRLYRIGGLQTVYTAVETLPSTATTYIDINTFTEIEGMVLASLRSYAPPTGLQYLTNHQGRFYGSVGAELYFTPPGNPDSWYALDYIAVDDVITGIASVANGLLIMSTHRTWLLTGNNVMNFMLHSLSNSEGCIAISTIAIQDGTAIWLSASGFVMSNGSHMDNVSLNKIGLIENIEPFGAVFVDKRYVLSFGGTLYPANDLYPANTLHPADLVTQGYSLPKGAIVIDFSAGQPVFSTIADVIMGYIVEANNEVYQISGEGSQRVNILLEDRSAALTVESGVSNIGAEVSTGTTLSKTFRGSEFRSITYMSPVYTEGAMNIQKQYEKIRITYNGVGVLTVMDEDGRDFVVKQLSSARRISEWVYIPVVFNRGYGIQFHLDGKFIVDSIQWVWTPKEAQ